MNSTTHPVLLGHRAVLSIDGPDAETYLHNLLTCGTLGVPFGGRRYGALLTPQGKVLSDLILERTPGGFFIDAPASQSPDLAARLQRFRLRAKVEISEREDLGVVAFSGTADPRGAALPTRAFASRAGLPDAAGPETYHRARIAAGVAEQGADFETGEAFPADVNMDLLGGVDFQKGCFVGQEVVSRMKRRGTARRRTLIVRRLSSNATSPSAILAAEVEIGLLTSRSGDLGLARVRIDRLAAAWAAGAALTCGGEAIEVDRPDWLIEEQAALAHGPETA